MAAQTLPRLAIQLRSLFPDATLDFSSRHSRLAVSFPAQPAWSVEVAASEGQESFCIVHSSVFLNYDSLQTLNDLDFQRLLASENAGLRGASFIAEPRRDRRVIRLTSSYYAQKGRTLDEVEALAIDVLSLLRVARLFDDRVLRSSVHGGFSLDLYESTYATKGRSRARYINYARSVFRGSTERVFGQVLGMLSGDYNYRMHRDGPLTALLSSPSAPLSLKLSIPAEVPMLICTAELMDVKSPSRAVTLANQLNAPAFLGHFEVNGGQISFASWKHLTNDLRYYSFDQLINAVHLADARLNQTVQAASASLTQAA